MDVKKLVKMTASCSNFQDHEINRIMEDDIARKAFVNLLVIFESISLFQDCYKIDDSTKRLECLVTKSITKLCGEENRDLVQCVQKARKKEQKNACNVEIVKSQRCIDDELHNLIIVSKGLTN